MQSCLVLSLRSSAGIPPVSKLCCRDLHRRIHAVVSSPWCICRAPCFSAVPDPLPSSPPPNPPLSVDFKVSRPLPHPPTLSIRSRSIPSGNLSLSPFLHSSILCSPLSPLSDQASTVSCSTAMSVSSSSSLVRVLQSPISHSELYGVEHPLVAQRSRARKIKTKREGKAPGKQTVSGGTGAGNTGSSRLTKQKKRRTGRKSKSTAELGSGGGTRSTGSCKTGLRTLTNSHSATPGSRSKTDLGKETTMSGTTSGRHAKKGTASSNAKNEEKKGAALIEDAAKGGAASSKSSAKGGTASSRGSTKNGASAYSTSSTLVQASHCHKPVSSAWPLAQVEKNSPQTSKKYAHRIDISRFSASSQWNNRTKLKGGERRGAWEASRSGGGASSSSLSQIPVTTASKNKTSEGTCRSGRIRTSTAVSLLSETDGVSTIHLSHPSTPSPASVTGYTNRRLPGSAVGHAGFPHWSRAAKRATTPLTPQLPPSFRLPRQGFTTTPSARGWGQGRGQLQVEDIAAGLGRLRYRSVIVMSGAGISTPSGIPDFR